MADDRSRDVSAALTEVRTVHSRALSAIDALENGAAYDSYRDPDYPSWEDSQDLGLTYHEWWYWEFDRIKMADRDHDEMLEALKKVVEILEPWKKKGRRKR